MCTNSPTTSQGTPGRYTPRSQPLDLPGTYNRRRRGGDARRPMFLAVDRGAHRQPVFDASIVRAQSTDVNHNVYTSSKMGRGNLSNLTTTASPSIVSVMTAYSVNRTRRIGDGMLATSTNFGIPPPSRSPHRPSLAALSMPHLPYTEQIFGQEAMVNFTPTATQMPTDLPTYRSNASILSLEQDVPIEMEPPIIDPQMRLFNRVSDMPPPIFHSSTAALPAPQSRLHNSGHLSASMSPLINTSYSQDISYALPADDDPTDTQYGVSVMQIMPGATEHAVPHFLRVYASANSETDHLLKWPYFQLTQLESLDESLLCLFKQRLVHVVIAYEAYRTSLTQERLRRREARSQRQIHTNVQTVTQTTVTLPQQPHMGVHGLWSLFEPSATPIHVESLSGKILAIDISIWLHQALHSHSEQRNAHLHVVFARLLKLLFYGIKPVFVFDGQNVPLKQHTLAARRLRRDVAAIQVTSTKRQLLAHYALQSAIDGEEEVDLARSPIKVRRLLAREVEEEDPFNVADKAAVNLPQDKDDDSSDDSDDDGQLAVAMALSRQAFEEHLNGPIDGQQPSTSTQGANEFDDIYSRRDALLTEQEAGKQTRTQRSKLDLLDSNDFSTQQMGRLLKRSNLAKEINQLNRVIGRQHAHGAGIADNSSNSVIQIRSTARRRRGRAVHLFVRHEQPISVERDAIEFEISPDKVKPDPQVGMASYVSGFTADWMSKEEEFSPKRKEEISPPSDDSPSPHRPISIDQAPVDQSASTVAPTAVIEPSSDSDDFLDVDDEPIVDRKSPAIRIERPPSDVDVQPVTISTLPASPATLRVDESDHEDESSPCASSSDPPPSVEPIARIDESTAVLEDRLDRQADSARQIGQSVYDDCQKLLRLFGVPYIMAEGEAEAQCANLETNQLVDGIVTEDSDVWLFGAQTVYRHLFNQQKHVLMYSADRFRTQTGLEREQLISVAMLCGCDYTAGVQGIGAVTALEILAEFSDQNMGGFDALQRFNSWRKREYDLANNPILDRLRRQLENVHIPESLPQRVVHEAFMNPTVDRSTEIFSWGDVDLANLTTYALEKLGFPESHTRSLLKPIIARRAPKSNQSASILAFTVRLSANHVTDIRQTHSKRTTAALEKLEKIRRNSPRRSAGDSVKRPMPTSKSPPKSNRAALLVKSGEQAKEITKRRRKADEGRRRVTKTPTMPTLEQPMSRVQRRSKRLQLKEAVLSESDSE